MIGAGVRAAIAAHVRAAPRTETGGILIGWELDECTVEITIASPPGPRAIRRGHFFLRDRRFLQSFLDREVARSDGAVDYIGEWHVHRALDAPPSWLDRRSLRRIARRSNYPTDNPLLLIVESVPGELGLRAYGFRVRPERSVIELVLSERRERARDAAVAR